MKIFFVSFGIEMLAWFVNHGNPWFKRGSGYSRGTGTGVFAFTNENGHANSDNSFRVVLVYYE